MKPSSRSRIASFLVMDVMEEAARIERSGTRVLHLEVGQPGTRAPEPVLRAAHRALDEELLGYTPAQGDPVVRERIAARYLEKDGVKLSPGRVFLTPGASGAFVVAFSMLFEAGQRVALTRPGYPCYRNILQALDLEAVEIEVGPDTGFSLSLPELKAAHEVVPLSGLVLASPANPTGTLIGEGKMRELLDYCAEEGIRVVVDEIYHGLTYGDSTTRSALALSDDVVIINSFSKYYSMTGWRLGWLIVPEGLRRTTEALGQNLVICPPTLSQIAARAAFESDEELEAHRLVYEQNRQTLKEALRSVGLTKMAPADGAFYLYVDVSEYCSSSRELSAKLLEQESVAATSGTDFDPIRGEKYLRFSYCITREDAEEAARRLVRFFESRVKR